MHAEEWIYKVITYCPGSVIVRGLKKCISKCPQFGVSFKRGCTVYKQEIMAGSIVYCHMRENFLMTTNRLC